MFISHPVSVRMLGQFGLHSDVRNPVGPAKPPAQAHLPCVTTNASRVEIPVVRFHLRHVMPLSGDTKHFFLGWGTVVEDRSEHLLPSGQSPRFTLETARLFQRKTRALEAFCYFLLRRTSCVPFHGVKIRCDGAVTF